MHRRTPAHLAILLSASFFAAALVCALGAASSARIPPDPAALVSRAKWVYDLRWDKGEVYLVDVHEVDLGEPRPSPRVMGRFALELYEGPILIERVRFDFPLLGAPAPDAGVGFRAPPRFEPKLRTRIGVLFPTTTRGTRLELWDRAEGTRWGLPWPPVRGPGGGLDAGPPEPLGIDGGERPLR